uniref:Uncharacterized protein n=1 Tax=Trypanosoma vivax (strain Y486) TaxID=1055687 RepID=G0UB22_TRYVY|nr:conserved hypothetical protein [Trypanosoma vivax Y486]
MLVRTLPLSSGEAFQAGADRLLVGRYHNAIIQKHYWNCSSPSQALAALTVLTRSGTMLDGLDKAASYALCSMAPAMTRGERALLLECSKSLRLTSVTNCLVNSVKERANILADEDPNAIVFALYSEFVDDHPMRMPHKVPPIVLSADSVRRLEATSAFMLFEMLVSTSFSPSAYWRSEPIVTSLLATMRHHILHGVVSFKALWWVVGNLNDARLCASRFALDCAHLFRACVKRLDEVFPRLSISDCLLMLPLLDTSFFDKPFILYSRVISRIASCSERELRAVPTHVLLYGLRCNCLNLNISRKLCHVLQSDARVYSLDDEESLSLLCVLTSKLVSTAVAIEGTNGRDESIYNDIGHLLDLLFAQLLINVGYMGALECVRAMECFEVITISNISISVPFDLLDRLRRRIYSCIRLDLRRSVAKVEATKSLLEVIHRLEGLLGRCVLLPFMERDAATLTELHSELEKRLTLTKK